ncbi:LuxR C-terminal-related transcriptional regulator [Streptacidiphilus sp. MAP5-3]|uniref:LuxR C-terminal-related transcriptional regulator n=1 Tax=unclassified Streptacidiphilus TaxID=2643834 RepID=UPI003514A55C
MLAARFTVPGPPKILVRRPALLEQLTAGVRGPLCLVNGPAGAGKTVLAANWISDGLSPYRTAWLTVEPGDAPGVFWAYVLEAFHRFDAQLPPDVGRPTRAEGVDGSLLARLADGLAQRADPVVLVLDQFDAAGAPEITAGLQFVLGHAGQGLRLLLTSRTDSLLPLHRYRAAGEIAEIRNADLRFTVAETAVLLHEHGLEISDEGILLLIDRTEGWAAGLRLCALAMQRSADPEAFVRRFAADRTAIADYLLTEVLGEQPAATQDLLLRVSVGDRVHPALADVLTGRDDAAWTLARLARANAFVEQIDESAWYRLHPLFAEVLRAHLRHRSPGLEPELHARAARWFARTGRLTDAVAQAAAAADWQFAATLLVENLVIVRLFTGLDTERLRHAFAGMPQDLSGTPTALVGAACRLADQDLVGGTSGLRSADATLHGGADPAALLSRAFVGVLAGRLGGDLSATRHSAADAEKLLDALPQPPLDQHRQIRAMVLAGLGAAELDAGHLERAGAELTAAVEACASPGTEVPLCDSLGSLALVELLRGHLRPAERHARESLTVAEQSALPKTRRSGLDHLVLAGVATEHNDLAAAQSHLDLAAASAGAGSEPIATVEAAVIGARLATAAGDWEGALTAVRTVASAASPLHLSAWTVDELAIAESRAHLAHGDTGAALDALDSAPSDRPEHTVARARALLAAGHSDRALLLLAGLSEQGSVTPTGRTQACLLQAQAAAADGSTEDAHRFLRTALGLARQEQLRRVFVESGPWVRRLLRQHPQLAQAHNWLPLHGSGPSHAGAGEQPAMVEPLTERESAVLRQAAQMLSTEEIAAELYVSANTVKTHLKSIYRKLCVTRRSEAVHRAQDLGLL